MARKAFTKAAAIRLFQEIETGRGGIAELVRDRPVLGALSRQALLERGAAADGVLTVYRAVAVLGRESLRGETVASTSLDWRVPAAMLPDFPLLMGERDFIDNRPHLLRYELPLERVLAYVPSLVDLALEALPDWRARKIADRWGGRQLLSTFVETGRDEHEVVADLSGLTPRVIAFESSAAGRLDMSLIEPVGDGYLTSGEDCFHHLWRNASFGFGGDRAAEIARLDRLAASIRALTATGSDGPAAAPSSPNWTAPR